MTLKGSTIKVGAILRNGGGLLEMSTQQTEGFGLYITDLKTKEKRRMDMSKGWIVKLEVTSYEKILVYSPDVDWAEAKAKEVMLNTKKANVSAVMVTTMESVESVSPDVEFYAIIGGSNGEEETQ